jgi:hypothetical protein
MAVALAIASLAASAPRSPCVSPARTMAPSTERKLSVSSRAPARSPALSLSSSARASLLRSSELTKKNQARSSITAMLITLSAIMR